MRVYVYRSRFQPGIQEPHAYAILWVKDVFKIKAADQENHLMLGVVGMMGGDGRFSGPLNPLREIDIAFNILDHITGGLELDRYKKPIVYIRKDIYESYEEKNNKKVKKLRVAYIYFPLPRIFDTLEKKDLISVVEIEGEAETETRKYFKGWLEKLMCKDKEVERVTWFFPIYDAADIMDMAELEKFYGDPDSYVKSRGRNLAVRKESIRSLHKDVEFYFVRFNYERKESEEATDKEGIQEIKVKIKGPMQPYKFGYYFKSIWDFYKRNQNHPERKNFDSFVLEIKLYKEEKFEKVKDMIILDVSGWPFIYSYYDFIEIVKLLGLSEDQLIMDLKKKGDDLFYIYYDLLSGFFEKIENREDNRAKLARMNYKDFIKFVVKLREELLKKIETKLEENNQLQEELRRKKEELRKRKDGLGDTPSEKQTRKDLQKQINKLGDEIEKLDAENQTLESRKNELDEIKNLLVDILDRTTGNADHNIININVVGNNDNMNDLLNKLADKLIDDKSLEEKIELIRHVLIHAQLSWIWGNGEYYFWLEDSYASRLKKELIKLL